MKTLTRFLARFRRNPDFPGLLAERYREGNRKAGR
jgi:hypothetical protein